MHFQNSTKSKAKEDYEMRNNKVKAKRESVKKRKERDGQWPGTGSSP